VKSIGDILAISSSLFDALFFLFYFAYDFHLAKWFVDLKIIKKQLKNTSKKAYIRVLASTSLLTSATK
jgi:hypothetical protein